VSDLLAERAAGPLGADPLSPAASSVLFLLGPCGRVEAPEAPCLILNKRSGKVRQPGDLCCPGGRLSLPLDRWLARAMTLPGMPLRRWPQWRRWRARQPEDAFFLALLLAAGLREGYEEMGLSPFNFRFLGPLPVQQLRLFRRTIFPQVGWVARPRGFSLNWEVEKIVRIPLENLLDPANYARYRLSVDPPRARQAGVLEDFPCFLHREPEGGEVLWGATYRITMDFLSRVFGFAPPEAGGLPVLTGRLGEDYLEGSGAAWTR